MSPRDSTGPDWARSTAPGRGGLEHVSLGQSRFMTPGVAPDPRGILLGRYGLLIFPTLEGVVSWLRLYSAESPLDELLAALEISQVRTPLGSREMAVRIPAISSYVVDRAARCALLVGGATYTGTAKHFVKYRDDRSPYGYDAADLTPLPPDASIMVHGEDFTQTYARERDLPLDRLLLRLSRRRIPGGADLRPDERRELFLVVAHGLGEGVIRYLWRNRVVGRVGLVTPERKSAFDESRARVHLLFRVQDLPARILDLFRSTPGIDIFRPLTENVAVEVGYAHPIDLASCQSLFEPSRFFLFWGQRDQVDTIAAPLELSGIEHLTRLDIQLDQATSGDTLQIAALDAVGVPLELAPSLNPSRRVVGSLIPLEQARWLKRLIYFLPQTSLRGHRMALTDRGILIVASPDVDVIPLGTPLAEVAPGLLVPLGWDLVPRVAPDVLARSLGHNAGLYTVFPPSGAAFQIGDSALAPLERRALARIEIGGAEVLDARIEPPAEPAVVNEPVGRFALWGFRAPGRGD
ncbi:MAG TPA: hypothetical protein VK698_10220 [Kofleriaceae bacterium]|nr:hypothetical protein [Kofleriaceae bacterium]